MSYQRVIMRDLDLCVECGACVEVCPMGCFSDFPDSDDFEDCGACGECSEVCDEGAILTIEE